MSRSPGEISAEEFHRLAEAGVVDKIELIRGQIVMGEWPVIFSPAQARVAAERGVRVPTCVDAVLADAEARAEIIERLG